MIAIKDMKMPKSCILCPFMDNDGWYCCDVNPEVVVSMDDERRAKKCPLVEIATCEHCKHNAKNEKACDMGHRFRMREPSTFYCADYKRSDKND
jgi:hypothetical protein